MHGCQKKTVHGSPNKHDKTTYVLLEGVWKHLNIPLLGQKMISAQKRSTQQTPAAGVNLRVVSPNQSCQHPVPGRGIIKFSQIITWYSMSSSDSHYVVFHLLESGREIVLKQWYPSPRRGANGIQPGWSHIHLVDIHLAEEALDFANRKAALRVPPGTPHPTRLAQSAWNAPEPGQQHGQ